jgi:hypothetical protein
MMKGIVPLLLLAFVSPVCRAQTGIDNLLTLDLDYSLTGLLNHGWGMGLGFEKKMSPYVSAKAALGHMTFLTGLAGVHCTSVHLSLFTNYYPLGNGLDKLYVGAGGSADFMNYFGDGKLPGETRDILISLIAKTGWKFRVFNKLMIDVFAGYKYIIPGERNYADAADYLNSGLQYGLNIKLFLHRKNRED